MYTEDIIDFCRKYSQRSFLSFCVIYVTKYDGNYFRQIENLKLDDLCGFPV